MLGRALLLPARRPADLDALLEAVPELRLLLLDGAERPIRRPKDKPRKKEDSSGKKKAHRKKNLLLSSHERRVVYLGPTSPGSVHDKKRADESGLRFPADALVVKATGFQGYEPPESSTPAAHQEAAWTRTLPVAEGDQQTGQHRARGRGTRDLRGEALPHRGRPVPQPAERLRGPSDGTGRRPAQPARDHPPSRGMSPLTASGRACLHLQTTSYKVYCLIPEALLVVGMQGFEPWTSWSQTRRSTKLSYIPN